jgi:hypothetical protein
MSACRLCRRSLGSNILNNNNSNPDDYGRREQNHCANRDHTSSHNSGGAGHLGDRTEHAQARRGLRGVSQRKGRRITLWTRLYIAMGPICCGQRMPSCICPDKPLQRSSHSSRMQAVRQSALSPAVSNRRDLYKNTCGRHVLSPGAPGN